MRSGSHVIFRFLPDDGVNKSRIDTLAFTRVKDYAVQIFVAGAWDVERYLTRCSRIGDGYRSHHAAEQNACQVSKKKEGKYGERRELQGTKVGQLAGKLHSVNS